MVGQEDPRKLAPLRDGVGLGRKEARGAQKGQEALLGKEIPTEERTSQNGCSWLVLACLQAD
jgi:hypothetical protein